MADIMRNNNSDLIETYTYDNETKTITLNCDEPIPNMVRRIIAEECTEEKLLLDFQEDILVFKKAAEWVRIMNKVMIRDAKIEDAGRILEIYAYYVTDTAISWEYEVPTLAAFEERMRKTMEKYPYLVVEQDGVVQGYAYAGPFVGRAAYDWSAELTIYLNIEAKRQGYGRMLYEELQNRLVKMGIQNIYACIGDIDVEDEYLNKNSTQFHEHMGFRKVGEFKKCGRKFNRWYDMIWMEKVIGKHDF